MGIYDPQDTVFIYNVLFLVGWTIQYWDYSLTIGDEVRYIWQRTNSKGKHWFYVNRYLPFFGNITIIVCSFYPFTTKSFWGFTVYHQVLLTAIQVIVALVLGLRTYALYNCSKIVLAGLVIVSCGCLATVAWSVTPHNGPVHRDTGIRLAAAWESLLVYDFVIFVLTMFKSRMALGSNNFVRLMLRDGAVYSGVMLVANAANVSTYYLGGPHLKGFLSTFSSGISLTMMNRLILNLRKNTEDVEASILSGSLHFQHGNGQSLVTVATDAESI